MGSRNCAEPTCTAVEFRETGFCHRHQDLVGSQVPAKNDQPPPVIVISKGMGAESTSLAGVALALFGIGLVAMLFGDFDMVCCGVLFIFIGVVLGSYDVLSRMFRPSQQRMG